MTIELLGVAGWTVEQKTFYEKKLLARAIPMFRYAGLGIKKPIPARGSKSIEWRRLERPGAATTALTEATPPAVTQTTWSNVVATVQQYGAWQQISDVAMTQSIDDSLPELTVMWGEHLKDTIDQTARTILVAGTNVQYANAATSRGALTKGNVMTEVEVRTALRNLKRRNTLPISALDDHYALILHPDQTYDLLSDSTIQNVLQDSAVRGDNNPYFSGRAWDYLGARLLETTNIAFVSGAGLSLAAAVHIFQAVMFGEGYYGETEFAEESMEIIVKPVGSAGAADPLNQYGTVGWKAAYAAVILNQNFGQRIETATAANATP